MEDDSGKGSTLVIDQTTEQLIVRCIAPVKKDFLRPPPDRTTTSSSAPVLAKEKKSKRQLKRERLQVPCSCLY